MEFVSVTRILKREHVTFIIMYWVYPSAQLLNAPSVSQKLIILQTCSSVARIRSCSPRRERPLANIFHEISPEIKNAFFKRFSLKNFCRPLKAEVKKSFNINVDFTEEFGVLQNPKLLCIMYLHCYSIWQRMFP